MICDIKQKYLDHFLSSCTSAFVYKFRICRSDYQIALWRAIAREREREDEPLVLFTEHNLMLI